MKKVMKTFAFGSKGFMRILLLCMIACFSLTQARADYYYKVKLADMNGNLYQINGKEWSDWIFVSKGSGLANALNKLIGGKFTEQVKDTDGELKFKYKDNNVEREISFTEDERDGLTKNGDGKYIYVNGGKEYVLDPVMKDVYRLGTTINDVKNIPISLGYNLGDGKEMAKEENFYENYEHTYKIVGLAIGRGTNDGAILQFSDWDAFSRMKHDLKELDLAAWNKEKVNGSYYMSNMSNLEKLILPDHNFAIGGDYMFAGANKLKIIQYGNYGANNDAENLTINTDDNKCKVTCIGHAAFESCHNLPGDYIRAMVNSAAAYAKEHANEDGFEYNKIGDNAFYQCRAFTGEFTIPDGIKYIGKQAFENGKISTLTCTSELKKIDDRAFKQNYQLQTVDLSNINEIGIEAFDMKNDGNSNNKPVLSTVSLGGNDIRIYSKAFRRCCYMTDFKLKNGAQIKQLNDGVFLDCRLIKSFAVQTIINNYAANSDQKYNGVEGAKFIPANLFFGANGKPDYGTEEEKNTVQKNFTELVIPSEFVVIGKGAFGVSETSNINSITVSRGVAPECDVLDGTNSDVKGRKVFDGVNPNYVTVYFNGDAAGYSSDRSTGYMTYRNEPEFMRLLTKTLNEDDEDYTVVAQRHANVLLKRKFKEGWNTLVLPFGARVIPGRDVDAAEIFQKALNTSEDGNFMIAAYRGLAKNTAQPDNSTFYFLQYANYKTDPIDEFEPLLIRMTQQDINNAKGKGEEQVYTFEDVELNYDGDNYTTYTAEEAKGRMGYRDNGGYFDGNYDKKNIEKFGKCSYDDFYFTGTLYKQNTDKNPAFIAPGDYIIQNNTFVKCISGKKYGLKGFRGYFKQKQKPSDGTSDGTSGAKGIGICLVDSNGVVSSIHQVDGVSLTPASVAPVAVYNLSGQKVGNSLSTLAKGVYIVNGKKFVKK